MPQWNSDKKIWEWWYWASYVVEPHGKYQSTSTEILPHLNFTGINQVEIAISRDLSHWERVADRAVFLGVEPFDGLNYGTTGLSVCGCPRVHQNREIWIYYNAQRFRGPKMLYQDVAPKFFDDASAMCLGKLRRDGFVSLDAADVGTVITKPFMLNGESLYINAAANHGDLRAEILDASTMEPLPGFSASQCISLRGDHLRGRMTWRGML